MCSQFTQPLCYTLYFVAMHPSEAHHLNSAHEICCFQNFLPQCFLEPNRCLCLVNGTFLFDCAGQHVGSSFPDQGPHPCLAEFSFSSPQPVLSHPRISPVWSPWPDFQSPEPMFPGLRTFSAALEPAQPEG